MNKTPNEHLALAELLLFTADEAFTDTAHEREQVTLLILRAQAHYGLAVAKRHIALSQ